MTPAVGSGGDDEDDPLRCSLQIITSLSASIDAVRCFQGRWSAVSATLGRLASSLSELSSLPPHPLSTALLLSLPPTLSSALSLSRLCASPSPSAGKLRTQSDLSSLSLSLSRLSSDADLLLRSGALLHGNSDHLRPLLTQLQMGGPASLSALSALPSLSDKALAAAAASHSLVPSLLRLLDSPSRDAKRKAAAAVARVSTLDACARTLALDGGAALVTALARALESDDASAEPACAALQTLTLTRDNAMALASRGSIPSLLAVCQGGTPPSQAAAAAVLKNLAAVPELRRLFVEEDAVPVLRGVLSFGTAAARENAVGCLSNLAAPRNLSDGDEERQLKLAIVRDGGLDCVKSYWDGGGGDQRLEPAIELLRNLASFHYIGDMIVSAGFLPLALSALSSTVWSVRTEAARLIAELASTAKVAKEAGELNCVNRLVGMMEAKSAEEMESAVRALDSLLLHCKGNRRRFRRDEKGIVNVVQLLDPLLRCVEKKYPVSVLLSVSESWRCRKQMVAAGAHGFLLRLAEGEVEGAKRLLESLGKGKLWGVFPRA